MLFDGLDHRFQAGGNVAALIKGDAELTGTPIVFLTAAVRKHQIEENDGVICDFPCIAKPASLETVIEAIEKHARK